MIEHNAGSTIPLGHSNCAVREFEDESTGYGKDWTDIRTLAPTVSDTEVGEILAICKDGGNIYSKPEGAATEVEPTVTINDALQGKFDSGILHVNVRLVLLETGL